MKPGEQEARDAGLRPESLLYRVAAVWWLPMGVRIVGRYRNDFGVLQLAHAF